MKENFTIIFSGSAGQGLKTLESLLPGILLESGYHFNISKEYMSRVRGGNNTLTVSVSDKPVSSYHHKGDLLLFLDGADISRCEKRWSDDSVILKSPRDKYDFPGYLKIYSFEEADIDKLGFNIFTASYALSAIGIEKDLLINWIKKQFQNKEESVIKSNLEMAEKGAKAFENTLNSPLFEAGKQEITNRITLHGYEGIGLGAAAGGCQFISSYPMSPATGVILFLEKEKQRFNMIVEQAEDEIAAINMALGAWYAGARSLVTTSGGGFALMEEGISLSGITETPCVVHIAQRPGPGTGLPTRTGQEDFNLVRFAGHGEFPRVVYAPSDSHEAFYLARTAFETADRFQIPAFILTDQYLMDNIRDYQAIEVPGATEEFVVTADSGYKRYALTENGISPRALPGMGEGLVYADSDEHTESGRITESAEVRRKMVDKRMKKTREIFKYIPSPVFSGPEDYKTLVISWGSVSPTAREAALLNEETAHLHVPVIFPLNPDIRKWTDRAENVIFVEMNYEGQFENYFKEVVPMKNVNHIRKYDGLMFSVNEIHQEITSIK